MAAARVGCEYHGPPPLLGLLPPTPDSWPCSCSRPGLRPRRKERWVLGNRTPTTPRRASSPGTGGGARGAEGDTCAFSVQLPDTSCRISELRDQTAAGGSPLPGRLTQARTVCQQIPSGPEPCSSRGLQTAPGQLCWRAERRNQYSQHTYTLSPSLRKHRPADAQPATHPQAPGADQGWSPGHTLIPSDSIADHTRHTSTETPNPVAQSRPRRTPPPGSSRPGARPGAWPERPSAPAQPRGLSPGVRPTQAPVRQQQACSQARHRPPLAALPQAAPDTHSQRSLTALARAGSRPTVTGARELTLPRGPGPRTPARTLPARSSPAVKLQLQQGLRPLRVAVQAPHGGRGGSWRGRARGTRADTRPPAPGLPATRPAWVARPSARRSPPLPAPGPSPRPAEPAPPPPARRSARPGRRTVAGAREGPRGAGPEQGRDQFACLYLIVRLDFYFHMLVY